MAAAKGRKEKHETVKDIKPLSMPKYMKKTLFVTFFTGYINYSPVNNRTFF